MQSAPIRNFWLVALTLFASYTLAANLAIALHEFGHAIGCLLGGGKVLGLMLSPQGYAGSYAARDFSVAFKTSHGYLLQVAGGPVFGAAFGAVLLAAARLLNRGGIPWIATFATALWCIGNNGAYLFLGSLYPFGDTQFLVELGVPRWCLFVAGLPLVATFLALFASFLHEIGLEKRDSYWRWVATIEAGLLGYLLFIAALRFFWPPDGQLPPTSNDLLGLALSPLAILVIATCAYAFQRVASQREPSTTSRWSSAAAVLVLGLLFMATEFRFFSYDYEMAEASKSPTPATRQ